MSTKWCRIIEFKVFTAVVWLIITVLSTSLAISLIFTEHYDSVKRMMNVYLFVIVEEKMVPNYYLDVKVLWNVSAMSGNA